MNKYWNWIMNIEDMWFDKIRRTMEMFDNPREVYFAKEKTLLNSNAFNIEDIGKLIKSKESFDLDKEMDLLEKKKIKMVSVGQDNYPKKLVMYQDKPFVLYYKGELPGIQKCVGIVGARNCSSYGKEISSHIGQVLGANGVSVISGMARGVDRYAHEGCINGGMSTYAILGCGVDICYPRENIELYTNMQHQGGVISEYPMGAEALPWRFPYRNRIISMLSDILVVVEAKEKSGTFITVDYALTYGKDVFAVPGRITDSLSIGCNKLIKAGAFPYTNGDDLLLHLGIEKDKKTIKNKFLLEKDFEVVYSCLCLYPMGVEKIVQETGYDIGKVYEILMKLRINGLVEEVFNGHYIKKL